MSRRATDPVTETPQKVRREFDEIIWGLRGKWSLELPLLRGTEARAEEVGSAKTSESMAGLAEKCSGQIRYMCYRECQLEVAMKSFDSEANQIMNSDWVYKPSQEKGTIPRQVTKTFIRSKREPTREERDLLIRALFKHVNEEYLLCRSSESYRGISAASDSMKGSDGVIRPQPAAKERNGELGPNSPTKSTRTSKKRNFESEEVCPATMETEKPTHTSQSPKSDKKKMVQKKLPSYMVPQKAVRPTVEPAPTIFQEVSYASAASIEPPKIFTPTQPASPNPQLSPQSDYGDISTQDIEGDQTFNESFNKSCEEKSKVDQICDVLCENSPFPRHEGLGDKTLGARYEIERFFALNPALLSQFLSNARKEGLSSTSSQDEIWNVCRRMLKDYHATAGSKATLPEKSDVAAYKAARSASFEKARDPQNQSLQRSVYLSGRLKFREKRLPGQSLFEFTLNPMQSDKSCRFHRHYGPGRFLTLSIPSLQRSIPDWLRADDHGHTFRLAFSRWIAGEHVILGRKWRFFYADDEEKKRDAPAGFKMHGFATGRYDRDIKHLTQISLEEFVNWHIPLRENSKSTDHKLFERFKLGLSKTTTTFPLKRSEFVRLPDSTDHQVMNDGCSRMSRTLAKYIADSLNLSEVPSAFQGRIAGAKGLWMVVPDDEFPQPGPPQRIEISDSQLKIQPHPAESPEADELQRTFEVLAFSQHPKAANLNSQVLSVLDHGQVPRPVFRALMEQAMQESYDELRGSVNSAPLTRSWVQSFGRSLDTKLCGSFPDSNSDQAVLLADAGYCLLDNGVLRNCLRKMIRDLLADCVQKMHMRVPLSTFVYCIPDPYGVLQPDEIHLGFSRFWEDNHSGFNESCIEGCDVLVSRNPALLPSDVQRRKAVFNPRLRHFKDVIVFPTTGENPLASLLSGGDYDGDKVWVCWDPRIVEPFKNCDLPEQPSPEECGIRLCNRAVRDIFVPGTLEMNKMKGDSQMREFFQGCFRFSLCPSMLGICTNEHANLINQAHDMSSVGAIKLATLSGYLVDAKKQGYELRDKNWQQIRKECVPQDFRNRIPAWKDENLVGKDVSDDSDILDWLKWGVAKVKEMAILTDFNQKWPDTRSHNKDGDLMKLWKSITEKAKQTASIGLKSELDTLRAQMESLRDNWASKIRGRAGDDFKRAVDQLQDQFRAIKPSSSLQHECTDVWAYGAQTRLGTWSLLRASCLYTLCPASHKLPWHMAADELCFMKVQEGPGFRCVVAPVHRVLKCDTKLAKKSQDSLGGLVAGDKLCDDEGDEELDGGL